MISVAEAKAAITCEFAPLPQEVVSLTSALGRVLAEDITSRVTQPPVDVSAMDGYAVRADDAATVPVTLRVIGESAAGAGFRGPVGRDEAVRISTGAPVPDGADAVVIQEETRAEETTVTIFDRPPPGRWIRRAGLDFALGQILLQIGQLLTSRDIALAAAMNVSWLRVRRKPRIAFVATGNELVMPGDPMSPHCIVSSNSFALAASVQALGGEPIDLGPARDDEATLLSALRAAHGADLLVTIGGASVGDRDLMHRVFGKPRFNLRFDKVAMRPGKPVMFGRLGELPVLALPGNPVSVGVTMMVLLKPALEAMLGINSDHVMPSTALLARDIPANDQRQDYLRSTLERDANGNLVATPFDTQDSSMLALWAAADCLVIRPPFARAARAGDRAEILLLRQGVTLF